jgi:hypothetical protein
MLGFVNGLLLALSTQRVLLLRFHGLAERKDYKFFDHFDTPVPWMSVDFVRAHDVKLDLENDTATKNLNYWMKSSIQSIMCSDQIEDRSYEIVRLTLAVQDVHLLHAASRYRLREAFRGLEFFFLSHFLWTGARELASPIRAGRILTPPHGTTSRAWVASSLKYAGTNLRC